MGKVKIPRKSVSLDMTAMCDMAFLLLNFFILTAKFKPEDPVTVDTPASVSELKLSDVGIMTISIDKDNRVFFGVEGQFLRQEMLELFCGQYKFACTPKEKQEFMLLSTFGVPATELRSILNMTNEERNKPGVQKGIPIDSADNQLNDWIAQARYAEKVLAVTKGETARGLKVAIRGDKATNYPTIKKIINTLQKQNINRFNFITNLEGKPAIAGAE
jgi:biopolymer transport protein ExbD